MSNPQQYFCLLHLSGREKVAQIGATEKYLPWYGAAALGSAGFAAGEKLLPRKYKAIGTLGGTLLGTAAGVHGGEALGRRLDKKKALMSKKAADEKRDSPAKIVGKGLLGLGAGTVTGYGIGKAIEHVARKKGIPKGKVLPPVLAAAGAGLGIGYPMWKAYEQEALRRAVENKRSPS